VYRFGPKNTRIKSKLAQNVATTNTEREQRALVNVVTPAVAKTAAGIDIARSASDAIQCSHIN